MIHACTYLTCPILCRLLPAPSGVLELYPLVGNQGYSKGDLLGSSGPTGRDYGMENCLAYGHMSEEESHYATIPAARGEESYYTDVPAEKDLKMQPTVPAVKGEELYYDAVPAEKDEKLHCAATLTSKEDANWAALTDSTEKHYATLREEKMKLHFPAIPVKQEVGFKYVNTDSASKAELPYRTLPGEEEASVYC